MSLLFTGCSAALLGGGVEAAADPRGVRGRVAVSRQRCCLHVAAAAAEHRRGSGGKRVPRGGVSVQRERAERPTQSPRGPGDDNTAGNSSGSAESNNAVNPDDSAASSALTTNSSPSTETTTTRATTPFELDGMDLFSGADFGAPPPPRRRGPASPSSPKSSKRRSPPPPPPTPATAVTATTRAGRPEKTVVARRGSRIGTGATRIPPALAAADRDPTAAARPSIDAVIVVEGANDVRAVTAAVNPSGGTMILKGSYNAKMGHYNVPGDVARAVSAAAAEHSRIIVLTDSDTAGRQLRSRIVQEVPTALHAFLGTHESSATRETKHHKPGNVGVEHAAPEAIRRALDAARPAASLGGSAGISREAFTRGDLARWGLCGPLGESAPDARWRGFGGVTARRRLVGEYLGVGDCDAKQLLRQMNLFFSAAEVAAAVDSLPGEGEAVPAKLTDGGSDRRQSGEGGGGGDHAEESGFDIYTYVPPGQAPPGFR